MSASVLVGNIEIIPLLDVDDWHLAGFFPSASRDRWETYRQLYPGSLCDGEGGICVAATDFILRSNGMTVLVDTGVGPGPHARLGGRSGQLLAGMERHGIAPGDIDIVVITHLHFDHVGWNAIEGPNGVTAVFPNARYLIPRKDWEHYTRPELAERTAYLRNTIELERLGQVDLVDGARPITPEVGVAPAPGHTPGHQVVLLGRQGEGGTIIGDAAHTPAQLQETGWSPQVDFDPEMAAATRAALVERIERTGGVLCAGHFPHPGMGHVVREGGLRVFRPLQDRR